MEAVRSPAGRVESDNGTGLSQLGICLPSCGKLNQSVPHSSRHGRRSIVFFRRISSFKFDRLFSTHRHIPYSGLIERNEGKKMLRMTFLFAGGFSLCKHRLAQPSVRHKMIYLLPGNPLFKHSGSCLFFIENYKKH